MLLCLENILIICAPTGILWIPTLWPCAHIGWLSQLLWFMYMYGFQCYYCSTPYGLHDINDSWVYYHNMHRGWSFHALLVVYYPILWHCWGSLITLLLHVYSTGTLVLASTNLRASHKFNACKHIKAKATSACTYTLYVWLAYMTCQKNWWSIAPIQIKTRSKIYGQFS